MALEDKDIFNAIFQKHSDQPIEFIMEQYEKAKLLNIAIERRLNQQPAQADTEADSAAAVASAAEAQPVEEAQQPAPVTKKIFTKQDLVCDPAGAITDNTITCCLCGKAACSLTSRHLANHGINVEEYKYLCGYPSEQKLMSKNFEAKMRRNVQRAQQARREKRRAEDNA